VIEGNWNVEQGEKKQWFRKKGVIKGYLSSPEEKRIDEVLSGPRSGGKEIGWTRMPGLEVSINKPAKN